MYLAECALWQQVEAEWRVNFRNKASPWKMPRVRVPAIPTTEQALGTGHRAYQAEPAFRAGPKRESGSCPLPVAPIQHGSQTPKISGAISEVQWFSARRLAKPFAGRDELSVNGPIRVSRISSRLSKIHKK